jgi:phospholipase D1/2
MADRGPPRNPDEDLAYGKFHEGSGSTDRGFIGDAFRRFRHHGGGAEAGPDVTHQFQPQVFNNPPPGQVPQPSSGVPTSGSRLDSLFNKGQDLAQKLGREVAQKMKDFETHSHTHVGEACSHGIHDHSQNRYRSFAPQRNGNDVKWYVDGCGYMYAVSKALESAKHSIWILDCKLIKWSQ